MSGGGGFTRWCLRTAARRWPAEIRDEMAREWLAELAALEAEPGTARQRLGFALSLLMSPPTRDGAAVPRGWAETSYAPGAALLVVALVAVALHAVAGTVTGPVLELLGFGAEAAFGWPGVLAEGVVVTTWCLLAGRWIGRRRPMSEGSRFGAATSAALAPLPVTAVFVLTNLTELALVPVVAVIVAALIWLPAVMALGVAAARARHLPVLLIVLAGLPVAAAVAAIGATVPLALTSASGTEAIVASMLLQGPPAEYTVLHGASSRPFYYFGPWAVTLVALGTLVLAYGRSAARGSAPVERPGPVAAAEVSPSRPLVAVGAGCVAAGVLAWAYTVAILSPAMDHAAEVAPGEGGTSELYTWVAELRWAAIILAALGLLAATADRRSAGRAAVLLAVLLFAANCVLLRAGLTGTGGLRLALLLGAGAVVLSWWAARGPLTQGQSLAVLRRTLLAAVGGSVCGPLLYSQGTPVVNHPYLPWGVTVTTTAMAVAGVILGVVPAATMGARRLSRPVAMLSIAVPVLTVTVLGCFLGAGFGDGTAMIGMYLGLPLAVVVIGALTRHRARRPGRTVAVWTALALAAVPGTLALWFVALFLSVAPETLFGLEGGGYPADGLSIVPGAMLVVLPLTVLLAHRRDHSAPVASVAAPTLIAR